MNDKIEVGEYIRTEKGVIDKVYKKEICHTGDLLYYCKTDDFWFFEITKHSKNLIDLIEPGDIVNGYVVGVCYGYDEDGNDRDELGILYDYEENSYLYLTNVEIKTILTHEQYEANAFKVGE